MAKKKQGKRKNNFIQRMVLRYRKSKKTQKKKSHAHFFLSRLFWTYVIVFGLIVFLGRANVRLAIKGYPKEDRQIIMKMDRESRKDYLSYKGVINISRWDKLDNQKHYYDYTIYKKIAKYKDDEHIIEFIDNYYELRPELEALGYTKEYCRSIMEFVGRTDFKYIVDNSIPYEKALPYLEVKGVQISDLEEYFKSNKDPKKAVMTISYSFIDSSLGEAEYDHLINSPGKLDVLIKNGFTLPSYYEPKDLMNVDIYRDDESTNIQLRKAAAQALEQMAADAEKEGLHLGIRSGYRSYKDQKQIYTEYVEMYGHDYAVTMVALPGSSEHQLGYGVDITSLSVINGEFQTFGETEEYQWVIKNGHKYGYILRYPGDKIDITGTMNEPWHFRYVGKEIAEECVKKNISLEEYVQIHGFNTTLVRVDN